MGFLKKLVKKLDPVGSKLISKDPVGKKLLGSSGGSKSAPSASMPPPPGRVTGGVGRVSATPTAKPMPKPNLNGKVPTGGSAPVAGSRSGVGRLAQFQGNRRNSRITK